MKNTRTKLTGEGSKPKAESVAGRDGKEIPAVAASDLAKTAARNHPVLRNSTAGELGTENPITKARRNPAIVALGKRAEADAEFRAQWMERNKPAGQPGEIDWSSGSRIPGGKESRETWDLHCLTYDYLQGRAFFLQPRPEETWRDYAVAALLDRVGPCLGHLLRLASKEADFWSRVESWPAKIAELAGRLAKWENTQAILGVARYSIEMVETLNKLLLNEKLAKLLLPFAREQRAWPVLKSKHTLFDQTKRELFRNEIGDDYPLNLDGAKWNPESEFGALALRLWNRVNDDRRQASQQAWFSPEGKAPNLPVAKLGPFKAPGEWMKWYAVAVIILNREFADPERWKTGFLRLLPRNWKKKSFGRQKNYIRLQVRKVFKGMAGGMRKQAEAIPPAKTLQGASPMTTKAASKPKIGILPRKSAGLDATVESLRKSNAAWPD